MFVVFGVSFHQPDKNLRVSLASGLSKKLPGALLSLETTNWINKLHQDKSAQQEHF